MKNLKWKDWVLIILSLGLIVYQVYLDLEIPGRMKQVTDLITSPNGTIKEILVQGGYMMSYALFSLMTSFIVGFIMARVAANFSYTLRENVFFTIADYKAEEIDKFQTSSLLTRSTNDVNNIQIFIVMSLQLLIKAPILSVWSILKIYNSGMEWSIATLIAVIVITIVLVILISLVVPKLKKIQKVTDELTESTDENLTGVRVIRAYNAESYQEEKFNETNKELMGINLFAGRTFSLLNPLLNLIISILMLAVYYIGAVLIFNKTNIFDQYNTFSDMLVFIQYAMMVIMSYMMLVMTFILLPRTLVSARRLNEVLDTKSSILDGNLTSSNNDGEIEFKNVSFKYPEAENYVLENINLKIKKGEKISFIGSTGSGKSTLINLIPRFYDVTEGEVLVDGINVKDYKIEDLNKKLGYVSQKAVLFKASIRDNVGLGFNEVDDDKVWEALEVAAGSDFVSSKEEVLDHLIAQSGTNLSGGQRQRVSIARAVYKDPSIYIFDDSFSALDFRTDKIVRDNLKNHNKDVTTLVVAQRIGTIMDSDKIVVLDNGKIVGIGKHDELIKNNEVYKEIALSQLSGGELE